MSVDEGLPKPSRRPSPHLSFRPKRRNPFTSERLRAAKAIRCCRAGMAPQSPPLRQTFGLPESLPTPSCHPLRERSSAVGRSVGLAFPRQPSRRRRLL